MTSDQRPWLGRVLLLITSLALVLGLSESLLRLRGFDAHPAAKYRFHSRYGWTMDPGAWNLDNLQASGFRTPLAAPGVAPSPRLLILGDSFTVAVERRWDETFAGILAADLEPLDGSLRSLSAGGWGTAQEYLALMHEGLDWQPDAVVLQVFPFNDVCNNGLAMAHTCSWQDHLRPYFVAADGNLQQTWLQPTQGRLRSASRLVGMIDRFDWWRRMGSPGESAEEFRQRTTEFTRASARSVGLEHEGTAYSLIPQDAQPEPVRQAWDATEALFAAIDAELDSRGIPLVAVVIPFSKTFGTDWRDYRRRRPRAMEHDHGTRHTEEILDRLGLPVVSVRDLIARENLEAKGLFNRFNRHLSASGHRWTADWIREELATLPAFHELADRDATR